MSKSPPRNPSIASRGGLQPYLDGTKDKHNGYGYDELYKRLTLKEPLTVIARAYNISATQLRFWISLDPELTKLKESHGQ